MDKDGIAATYYLSRSLNIWWKIGVSIVDDDVLSDRDEHMHSDDATFIDIYK